MSVQFLPMSWLSCTSEIQLKAKLSIGINSLLMGELCSYLEILLCFCSEGWSKDIRNIAVIFCLFKELFA